MGQIWVDAYILIFNTWTIKTKGKNEMKIMNKSMTLINGISGTVTRGMLIASTVLLFITLSFSYAVCEESSKTPKGAAPSVQAVEVEKANSVFRKGNDKPVPRPNHPPIDQIQSIQMPERLEMDGFPKSTGPGSAVYHNMKTGETIEEPADESVRSDGLEQQQVGGYNGADGGEQDTEYWRTRFRNMSKVPNTQDHPWRMNVKLIIWFENAAEPFGCSGSMIGSKAVLTAGHCVYDQKYGWAKEIWVYPGQNSTNRPYGVGTARINMATRTEWIYDGNFNYDVGVIGIDRTLGFLTGWFGLDGNDSCSSSLSKTYGNASYPGDVCFDGEDMYHWFGIFEACDSRNLLLYTPGTECLDNAWRGMSGSGAYYKDANNLRYIHAICSSSNFYKNYVWYCKLWGDWINYIYNTFIPSLRGVTFDLQALNVTVDPATINPGDTITVMKHLATNPTNAGKNGKWTYRVYLSTNDNISSSDTLLSTQNYTWDFNAVSSVWVNMVQVTIPSDTPPGDYWIGIKYDSATDGDSTNNETDGWDAAAIHVN